MITIEISESAAYYIGIVLKGRYIETVDLYRAANPESGIARTLGGQLTLEAETINALSVGIRTHWSRG